MGCWTKYVQMSLNREFEVGENAFNLDITQTSQIDNSWFVSDTNLCVKCEKWYKMKIGLLKMAQTK